MMEKLFRHPGWLKVLSILGAVMLWAYVMPGYTKDTSKPFYDVPVIVKPNPNFEMYEGLDARATVQIRAEGKGLAVSRLKREEVSAVVDLSQVTEAGKPTTVDVKVVGPDRVNYVVTPSAFTVTLIEKRTDSFPVTLEAASGHKVVNGREYLFTAKPEHDVVSLTGRGDFLSRVKQAVVRLDEGALSPGDTSIVRTAIPMDAAGKEVANVARPQVAIHLVWEQLPPGNAFKVQPATQGTVPPGFTVTKLEVEPAFSTVRATTLKDALPAQAVIQTAPVDLTGKTQSFSATVKLVPPTGTTTTIDLVTVKVTIEEIVLDKVFNGVPLKTTGQNNALAVTLAPSEVQVRVKGPYSVLNTLDASALHAYVGLEGVQAGKQRLPVKYTVPAGVNEITVEPAFVDVTVTGR
ncbi:MAG: hypothetical protein JWN15_1428 [Firmicutes bacterium]|nr:hypothetical protein [Bacillota bacterium]